MTPKDPELTRLLVQELERHLVVLEAGTDGEAHEDDASRRASLEPVRRAIHALKGSAGLAGEPELSAALQRIERRLREGDPGARGAAARLVAEAAASLRRGESIAGPSWPVPPDDLCPQKVEPVLRAQYVAEVGDRLAAIDDALGRLDAPAAAVAEIYRHVHTVKGAASAAGDEPMTWFCHGLEERLRVRDDVGAEAALEEVARYRAVLGGLLEDPEAALTTLRKKRSTRPSALERDGRWSREPEEGRAPSEVDATLRVPKGAVDALLEHLGGITVARERVAGRVRGARLQATALRRLRADLAEALRLIGPPRPWGAPAAALRRVERTAADLARMGDDMDRVAEVLRQSDTVLRDDTAAARRLLSSMRMTPVRDLFARVANAALAEARRSGKVVAVRTVGGDELVDRKLVQALVEPCMQLARNAIAHGIESPEDRARLGKGEATLTLGARRRGTRLLVSIADDGAGVDAARVRETAVEAGIVTEALAAAADDQTLLELLFVPGFSTRAQSPDVLAGRGVGLDIVHAAIQRLAGTIRLSSRQGLGFEARIDVPMESGLAHVLWVRVDGTEYAIPAIHARRVRPGHEGRAVHLGACLDGRANADTALAVELDLGDDADDGLAVGVDEVLAREDVLVRALSPLVWGMGPFAGAVVRGDGTVRLALDAHAIAPRARAIGRVAPLGEGA